MDDGCGLKGEAFCAELVEAVMVGGQWLELRGRVQFGPYHQFAGHRDLPGSEVEAGFWFRLRSGAVVFGPVSSIQVYRLSPGTPSSAL